MKLDFHWLTNQAKELLIKVKLYNNYYLIKTAKHTLLLLMQQDMPFVIICSCKPYKTTLPGEICLVQCMRCHLVSGWMDNETFHS